MKTSIRNVIRNWVRSNTVRAAVVSGLFLLVITIVNRLSCNYPQPEWIHFSIVDKTTSKAIFGADVQINPGKIFGKTNRNGIFEFQLYPELSDDSLIINISKYGYRDTSFVISVDSLNSKKIQISQKTEILRF